MKKNIFKDTVFGTIFITKSGKRAILSSYHNDCAFCLVESVHETFYTNVLKEYRLDGTHIGKESDLDIVGIYNEDFVDKEIELKTYKSIEKEYWKITNWKKGILVKIYRFFNKEK